MGFPLEELPHSYRRKPTFATYESSVPSIDPFGSKNGLCFLWLLLTELKPASATTTCAAPQNVPRGELLLPVYRRLLAVAGLVLLFPSTTALAQGGPPAMLVTIAPPIAKRVTQWDEFSGRFEAVASVEVRARVSGFIDKLHFRDGQVINVGDLLFTIDKRPFEIAVESAKADVARNKAQVGLAELQVQRGASLITSRTITDQEYDQRKANLDVAKAQLKAAEAAQRSAELNLDWTDVRAPIAGRISDRKVDAGNLIQGGQTGASLLATIVTLDPIRFVFDVSETDYLRYTRLFLSGELASSREKNPVRIRLAD